MTQHIAERNQNCDTVRSLLVEWRSVTHAGVARPRVECSERAGAVSGARRSLSVKSPDGNVATSTFESDVCSSALSFTPFARACSFCVDEGHAGRECA
jgi:hypothetical protein